MWNFHEYRIFCFSKVLMFGILQGLCVVLADTNTMTVYRAPGTSLDLIVNLSKESVSEVEWSFNGKRFAEYSKGQININPETQFTERLKKESDIIGVTVQDLQHQDAGKFSMVVDGTERQYPTKTITLYIQNSITSVQTEKNQTWMLSINSCDISVKCSALRAESVSYLWSGYKTGNGSDLQFSLSPAEGAVTLNCTAVNKVSSNSTTETLSCMGNPSISPDSGLVWIIIAGGVALLLLIAVILAITCWWRSHKARSVSEGESTVYASVTPGATANKDKRSDSVNNGTTVYETVEDLRTTPDMTIYAKVTFPQHAKVNATSSSPYQQVC